MNDNISILAYAEDILPTYADNQFDLAIVDPPYYSGPEKRKYYGKSKSSNFKLLTNG